MSLVSFSGTLSGVNVTGVFLQGLFPVLMLLVLFSGTNFGVNVSVFFQGLFPMWPLLPRPSGQLT